MPAAPPPLLFLLLEQEGGGAPPVAPPEDVIAAIAAKWRDDPTLTAISPGLVLTMGPIEPEPPMATYFVVADVTAGKNTMSGYYEDKVVQINLYDDDDDRLAASEAAVEAAYDPLQRTKALAFTNGYLMRFQRVGGGFGNTRRRTRSGNYVLHRWFTYRVWAGRNIA